MIFLARNLHSVGEFASQPWLMTPKGVHQGLAPKIVKKIALDLVTPPTTELGLIRQ